jgi:hypothetical protein
MEKSSEEMEKDGNNMIPNMYVLNYNLMKIMTDNGFLEELMEECQNEIGCGRYCSYPTTQPNNEE